MHNIHIFFIIPTWYLSNNFLHFYPFSFSFAFGLSEYGRNTIEYRDLVALSHLSIKNQSVIQIADKILIVEYSCASAEVPSAKSHVSARLL